MLHVLGLRPGDQRSFIVKATALLYVRQSGNLSYARQFINCILTDISDFHTFGHYLKTLTPQIYVDPTRVTSLHYRIAHS